MAQYSVHKTSTLKTAHMLELRKDGKAIAKIDSLGDHVMWISSQPDKEFLNIHGRTPAMELVCHLAKLVNPEGRARLRFWSVKPPGRKLVQNMVNRGIGVIKKDEGRHITFLTSARPKLPLAE